MKSIFNKTSIILKTALILTLVLGTSPLVNAAGNPDFPEAPKSRFSRLSALFGEAKDAIRGAAAGAAARAQEAARAAADRLRQTYEELTRVEGAAAARPLQPPRAPEVLADGAAAAPLPPRGADPVHEGRSADGGELVLHHVCGEVARVQKSVFQGFYIDHSTKDESSGGIELILGCMGNVLPLNACAVYQQFRSLGSYATVIDGVLETLATHPSVVSIFEGDLQRAELFQTYVRDMREALLRFRDHPARQPFMDQSEVMVAIMGPMVVEMFDQLSTHYENEGGRALGRQLKDRLGDVLDGGLNPAQRTFEILRRVGILPTLAAQAEEELITTEEMGRLQRLVTLPRKGAGLVAVLGGPGETAAVLQALLSVVDRVMKTVLEVEQAVADLKDPEEELNLENSVTGPQDFEDGSTERLLLDMAFARAHAPCAARLAYLNVWRELRATKDVLKAEVENIAASRNSEERRVARSALAEAATCATYAYAQESEFEGGRRGAEIGRSWQDREAAVTQARANGLLAIEAAPARRAIEDAPEEALVAAGVAGPVAVVSPAVQLFRKAYVRADFRGLLTGLIETLRKQAAAPSRVVAVEEVEAAA